MKKHPKTANEEAAFSLPELCVVIACIAVLFSLLAPALAATKTQSASAGCLSNMRQLMTGWEMYREESNDYLMPNAPLGPSHLNGTWINSLNGENWESSPENIDPSYYTNALMWRYVRNNLSVYHCPGDVVPSDNGMRIRSYSMNGQVGDTYNAQTIKNQNPGFQVYVKGADIVRPAPSNLYVFADESPVTINDGLLEAELFQPGFDDLPASYLDGGCGFSFADGHAEIHHWLTSVLRVPVIYGKIQYTTSVSASGGANNADWVWFSSHAGSK